MTTFTIRDLCAALSGDVNYLIACIRDGSSDSCALQECLDRANAARDLLAAELVGEGPNEKELYDLADEFNGDPVPAMRAALARWGRPAAPAVPEVPEVGEVEMSAKEIEAQNAFTQMRDEILNLSDGVEVNQVLGIIDNHTPEWV